jgi:hypothetical protein
MPVIDTILLIIGLGMHVEKYNLLRLLNEHVI